MTITELMAKLEALKAEHGDLRVAYRDWEGGGFWSADEVGVIQLCPKHSPWLEYASALGTGPSQPFVVITD